MYSRPVSFALLLSIAMAGFITAQTLALADEGEHEYEDAVVFPVTARAGYVFETQDSSGAQHMVSIGVDAFHDEATVIKVYEDGRREVIGRRAVDIFSGRVDMDIADPQVRYIEVVLINYTSIESVESGGIFGGRDQLNLRGLVFRFQRGQPLTYELRVFDVKKDIDLVGSSVNGRALRMGYGLGGDLFWADKTFAAGLFYGRLSGVFAFNPRLGARAELEVHPVYGLAAGSAMIGGIGSLNASLQFRVSRNVLVYLENRFQMTALLTKPRSQGYQWDVTTDNRVTGGALYRW